MKISRDTLQQKIFSTESLKAELLRQRLKNKKIVFTNGVFDIVHEGHISSLIQAAACGDFLIVALNSDDSVKRLKGPDRPANNIETRSAVLSAFIMVDAVVVFDDDTPLNLIKELLPDVLIKGGDYSIEQIAGAKEVIENGGQVILADMVPGISTTKIISSINKKN
ncbi:MAG: D-glycero-beta-D-manno-heptose 1-phosphate adenylyltransferase [Bacteroidetes bacterium]|nr:D-glycero-beta-D-manno-heptose 1-phosphate adenylyltransferase [Bacteroidota bacterium]